LVETGAVEVGAAEVRVEDGGITTEDEGGTTTEDDGGTTTEEDPAPVPQVPKRGWQPVPQWTEVLSHQPALEQQFPKVDPWHVAPPFVAPQVPSVDTRVAVEEGAAEVVVPVPAVEVVTVPGVELRYQLATGSLRHSPIVTALYPSA